MPLTVERVRLPDEGNLQAAGPRRPLRGWPSGCAEGDYAAAHTASDQAETVLYRLAVSPGPAGAAGHGAAAAGGWCARCWRPPARRRASYCRARGLRLARGRRPTTTRASRARACAHELLPALRELAPAAERTIAETARLLREEAEVLDAAAAEALAGLGGGPAVELAALRALPPALARLVLRELAEEAAGSRAPCRVREADAVLALGRAAAGPRALDLGGGLRAVAEYGTLRFRPRRGRRRRPSRCALPVPGVAPLRRLGGRGGAGAGEVTVAVARVDGPADGARLARGRPHAPGRPGRHQDARRTCSPTARCRARCAARCRWWSRGGEIVWVAGVALDERFAAAPGDPGAVGLVGAPER